jgi:hypothetical protein
MAQPEAGSRQGHTAPNVVDILRSKMQSGPS